MTKKIIFLIFLSLFLTTNANASLTYVSGTSEGVIYDDINNMYWFSDLSVFGGMTFDRQIATIDTLPSAFSYPFTWHMVTEQEIIALSESYNPRTIASVFKNTDTNPSDWKGRTQWVSPDFPNTSHVIYTVQRNNYTGEFVDWFTTNSTDQGNHSMYCAWVVGEPNGMLVTSLDCLSTKLRAASRLCKSYANCNARGMINPDFDLASCFSMPEAWFEWYWDKAEDDAAKKGQGCSTVSDSAIEDIILLGLEDIYGQIGAGLDLENRTANFLGGYLLRAVGALSSSLLSAEGENIRMENSDRLQSARDKAYLLFERQWIYAMSWVERRDLTYTGPTITEVENMVDNMVLDLLEGMESL